MDSSAIKPGVIGYVFRIDCKSDTWSYIGQSTRLDPEHVNDYYGSGFQIKEALTLHGPDALEKTIIATATNELELHYLEMLHLAEARVAGIDLLNGDFGGPRPFPNFQEFLWEEAPKVMSARHDPKRFHKALAANRVRVEAAIESAMAITPDEFYEGYEQDLLDIMDLSCPCPTCGSPVGEVCRTNAKSDSLPHNPSANHKRRPTAPSE